MLRLVPLLGIVLLGQVAPESCVYSDGVLITPLGEEALEVPAVDAAGQPGLIHGLVFGVRDADDVPLEGALVRLWRGDELLREVQTLPDGYYELPDVPPGEYGLVAEAEGYEPERGPVLVEPGQEVVRDFHLLPLPEPGVVWGHVFGILPGEHEVPLVGALVQLLRDGHVLREVQTQQEGHYELIDVPPGEYGLRATAEGFEPETVPVLVEPGQAARRDFHLPKALEPGAIVGRVFAAVPHGDEVPLPGALVVLLHGEQVVRSAVANHEGCYELPELRPGGYVIVAQAEGFEPLAALVGIEPGHVTHRDFVLHRLLEPGAVVGCVFGLTDGGDEIPLGGAFVELWHGEELVREVRTNPDGHYEMHGVRPGEYRLCAHAPGYLPREVPLEVHPGQVTEQSFVLPPAPEPGTIEGQVRGLTAGGDEVPLDGALVLVLRAGHVIRDARTDRHGHYNMGPLLPGEYLVLAGAEGYHFAHAPVVVEPGEVTVRDFVLRPLE
ncbi:MAG: carboxypeptidase-like regulatory domain-containing protein [Planctomycetes bacterium]|nr:carboxypeptidase-like regulatory domain-containing protein [Planctomycetota bacterium]